MLEITSCIMQHNYGIKLTVIDRSLADGGITYFSRFHRDRMPPQDFYALPDEEKYMYAKHVTHQNGIDADLGYFIDVEGELVNVYGIAACGSDSCPGPEYVQDGFKAETALAANWEMLQTMHQTFPLENATFDRHLVWLIHDYACRTEPENPNIEDFFLDCEVPDETDENTYPFGWGGIIQHRDGHATHYHARIRCPDDDSQCLEPTAGSELRYELLHDLGIDIRWQKGVNGRMIVNESPLGTKYIVVPTRIHAAFATKPNWWCSPPNTGLAMDWFAVPALSRGIGLENRTNVRYSLRHDRRWS